MTIHTPAPARLNTIDIFRGLTILEVIGHHVSGMALRHVTPGSTTHELLTVLNRTLHFAVPAFVFLSAVVLTRSLLKRFEPARYFPRRLVRGGWPYLLWSALYAAWYVWLELRPEATLSDPKRWETWLLYGKASYHLYFLLVALELYVVLPLLLPLARRRPRISVALVAGLALQLALYTLNREVLRLPFPASTLLWYALPVVLGVAVGARFDEFAGWWRRRRVVLLPLLAVTYALYLPVALAYVRGESVTPVVYSGLTWVYTALWAVTLLGVATSAARFPKWLTAPLALLGTVSLQVYLIHPMLLQLLEREGFPSGTAPFLLRVAGYALMALALPAAFGRLLRGTRVSTLLFGR
ncbi:acyltransferase [Deinococcus maricopensis]|uniref:Acyltransferase 3 n=1 Tax=Deinococcus maricopensis (strain DSM 21211 / LMG 22137 / NRRL B-23946 / LB-34) TaxID=709986 RepID=E8U726_DEIML|nr:acyltransferase [Deinococcus maricopensis]ADV66865.1 acyltransferase 3 [Deinococcus maricopensis DSM 21211]